MAALLWLFPDHEIRRLAPGYLIPTIEALPKLWKQILAELSRRQSDVRPQGALLQTPTLAYTIASAYLYVLNEHGRRQIYESPDNLAEPLPIKQFLENFLCLARKLVKKDPNMTAARLKLSVCATIDCAALTEDLLPESTWVWAIRPAAEVVDKLAADSLESLKHLVEKFWLTTGSYPKEHALSNQVFFVRIRQDDTGSVGSVDRLMASLAVRFSLLFNIRKEPFTEELKAVSWNRVSVSSWHQGLSYSGRLKALLRSKAADPLSEFFRFECDRPRDEQYRQLLRISHRSTS